MEGKERWEIESERHIHNPQIDILRSGNYEIY